MSSRTAILIVEDEAIIGMALSTAVRFGGGEVVGPAASVKAALTLLDTHSVAGAILDVQLADGLVSPLVKYLTNRNIPLIIQTGGNIPDELAAEFPDVIVRMKPNFSQSLVGELLGLIRDGRPSTTSLPAAFNSKSMPDRNGAERQ